jgi:CRP-like cAMP-binding protein
MYNQFGTGRFDADSSIGFAGSQPDALDALVALERIGVRRSFSRENEIYAEGDASDSWYRVISGTIRICKLLPDGRRHIAEFCFAGDCFGLNTSGARGFSAEAVGDVVLMRYPLRATERLLDDNPQLARRICDITLRDLAHAQSRMLLLGRMTAPERVASFLLEMSERRDAQRAFDLPMSRLDIADYLGLTIETVCRALTALKRAGTIAIPNSHRIELCDRRALAAACEA